MGSPRKTTEEQLADAMVIIREKNKILLENKKQIETLTQDQDDARNIRENIYKIAAYDPAPPEWTVKSKTGNNRGCPVTMWSDWHYGEQIFKAQVGGVNEFNRTIAKRRVKKLVETTIDLAHNHMGRATIEYPGVVICLGGDMLGGSIHEELAKTNDRTTQQAIEDLIDLLAAGIETMATSFGKAFIPCVVGNHGRSTRKMEAKDRVLSSHEWNVYCGLARHFKKSKSVQFMIPEGADAMFRVYGHRYFLTHGDSLGTRGGDGIIGAIGPILRGSLKTAHSEAQIGRDYDTLLIGHYHQMLWLPRVICNGSLKGYDEYARLFLRAPYNPPSQALWFSHPRHGVTARWEILLEPRVGARENKEWVSWAA
jgi:hypothetical protein